MDERHIPKEPKLTYDLRGFLAQHISNEEWKLIAPEYTSQELERLRKIQSEKREQK